MNRHRIAAGGAPLAIVAGLFVVAAAGGLATDTGPWYRALKTPAWKPPDWAFGPVWMCLYVVTGLAILRAWRASGSPRLRLATVLACLANGALNVLWSVLFFTLRRPDWSLYGSAALLLSIVAMMLLFARASPAAAALLLPYLAWVALATALNAAIVELNPVREVLLQ